MLDLDPVLWRQTSTWGARLTLFGWLGLTMVLASQAVIHDGYADAAAGQWLGRRLLLVGMAFAAAASFRDEKGNGGLELLLVTPLSPADLVDGRLRGLARQFGPAAAVLIVLQLTLTLFMSPSGRAPGQVPALSWMLGNADPSDWMKAVFVVLAAFADFVAWLAASAALGIALSVGRTVFLLGFFATAAAHHLAALSGELLAGLFRLGPPKPFAPWAPLDWDGTPTAVSLVIAVIVFPVARRIAIRRLAERRFLGR